MDQLANQVQNDDGPADLAKGVQEASASPSPTASDKPQASNSFGSDSDKSGGIGESGTKDNVRFNANLFEKGQVFVVTDKQVQRMVDFHSEPEVTLEKVVWQVIVNKDIETLGSSTTFGSSKRDMNQFLDGKIYAKT